ncbi:protein cramped-like isoform X2 [Amphiura filiformis]|uniref:protein cramped-like isoform X2 n=1 Tax=Amphiura filiformis TaxID=82378 RepID=UPI003B21C802
MKKECVSLMTKRKKPQDTQKLAGCEVKNGMPGTDADGEKEETNRKRSRSEDEVAETAPKQTEQYGDHPVSIQSTSKHDNLSPPVFQINYPFLRSSVKRLKKDASPPPEPPPATKKGDYQKPVKAVKAERKRWEAWGNQDKTLFFEGLNEYGKDFEAIQKYIEQRHKKRGDPGGQVKNKDQVRHLYYRTCHKLFKYITPDKDQSKTANELYALINYGELRKKIKGAIDARTGQKLNELVKKGSTTIRYQQRNTRLRTPTCKALKQLRAGDEEEVVKPLKLPPRVLLELIPKNNAAWTTVQGVAHNPRVRMVVPLRKELGSLLNMLSEKWTPHRIKLLQSMRPASSDDLPQVKLQTVKGTKITPYDQLKGFYIHDKSRVPFYVGLVDPRIKAACSNRKGAVSKAASAMERMTSPVESDTMLAKQHDAKSPGSPIETEASVANQQDPHSEMDFVDRTTSPSLQTREWLEEPSAEGDIDLALPTEFTPISMTEITDNFSVPSNQMDHTRIEVSNHRRKIWEEEESAEMGNGNNVVDNVEQYLSSPDKDLGSDGEKSSVPEQSKDERIQAGVTKENVGDMAITDVYLMLGMPKVVKLAYDFVHAASSQPKARLLDRLTHLAKTEFRDLIKPVQMVSVGVATSPTRLHIPPRNAETPPSKSNVPNQGKSPIPNRATMSRGRNTIVTPKSSRANAPIIVSPATAAAAVAKACEARGVANGPQTRRDKAIFLAPKPVAPRRITPTPANGVGEAERLFKAQLESLQRSDWQLPKRQARKPRGRRPLVVQRTLLPRPQSDDIRHMMTMSIVSNSSRASTGQFMPMKIVTPAGPESPQQQQQSQEPAVISNPSSPMPIAPNNIVVTSLVASTPKSTANSGTNGIDLNSPVASPLGSIFISSPVASPVTVEVLSPGTALSPVALSPMPQSPSALSPAAALSPVAIEVSNAGSPLALTTVSTLVTNSMTQNALITDPLLSTPPPAPKLINTSTLCTPSPLLNKSTGAAAPSLTISPPNISSLLDISLPSAESASSVGTDSLIDSLGLTGFGNAATTDSTGFCQPPSSSPPSPPRASGSNTPPLTMTSPSSSPFKLSSLGPDNQWLNGEAADISFSSILANLESPEKKDKPSSTSLNTPLVASSSPPRRLSSPPPTCPSPGHNFMENSRDSSLLGKDVDSHLFQCMMNENSIDYVAKFADLAAHISASTEPPKS